MDGNGSTMKKRAVEDLDKSVRDLVMEGKLDVKFDSRQPPPDGFKVAVEQGRLRVELPKPARFSAGFLIALLFPAVFIYIGVWVSDASIAFGFFGILFLILMVSAFFWNSIATPVLLLHRNQIKYFQKTQWGETAGRLLDSSDIESVRVGRITDRNENDGVLIVTDDNTLKIGDGLPAESLNWLWSCILAVITSKKQS